MDRETVLKILSAHRQELSQMGVKSLALFGSVARNEARSDSDVDLLIEFSQAVGLFALIDLKNHLENLLACPVDLGTPRSLKPILQAQVLKEAIYVP
jgi:hypothetical protein